MKSLRSIQRSTKFCRSNETPFRAGWCWNDVMTSRLRKSLGRTQSPKSRDEERSYIAIPERLGGELFPTNSDGGDHTYTLRRDGTAGLPGALKVQSTTSSRRRRQRASGLSPMTTAPSISAACVQTVLGRDWKGSIRPPHGNKAIQRQTTGYRSLIAESHAPEIALQRFANVDSLVKTRFEEVPAL